MFVYLFIALLLFIGYISKNTGKRYMIAMYLLLFVFTAFHNPYIMGTDGMNYISFFYNISANIFKIFDSQYRYEIGYVFYNVVIKMFTDSYFVFQFIYCAISTILLFCVVEKTGFSYREKCLLIYVYFCFRYFQNSMEFLRQNIAILLVWNSLLLMMYTKKRTGYFWKIFNYAVSNVLAWLFHRSAVLNIVIQPIIAFINKINVKKVVIITVISSVIILCFGSSIASRLISSITLLGNPCYEVYSSASDIGSINWINYLIRLTFYIIYSINIVNRKKSSLGNMDITILSISSIAIIIGSFNSSIITRFLEYYMIGIYMMIVKSIGTFRKGNSKKIYTLSVACILLVILIRNLFTVSGGTYLNYQFFPIENINMINR